MPSIINDSAADMQNYYVSPVGVTVAGRTKEYATYTEMLSDPNPGKYGRVADATDDPTVKSGFAIYRRDGKVWTKIYEEESMDLEEKITWETLPGKPDISAADLESLLGLISAIKHINVVRPVDDDPLHLKIEIYDAPAMEQVITTIDSRTQEGRSAMLYTDGTAYLAFPETGQPSSGQGRCTLVDIGNLDFDSTLFLRITWSDTTNTKTYSMVTAFPSFPMTDMFALGLYWKNL